MLSTMSNYRSSFNSAINYSKQQSFKKHSCNVMEMLVVEEVEKQIQDLPIKTAHYIKAPEVVAYALNRLPGLYATSKRGWQRQWHYGKTELSEKIAIAVRQGIVAVQRDPLRVNDPLHLQQEDLSAMYALEKLKVLLQCEDLSWEQLPDIVEQKLLSISRGRTASYRASDSTQYTFDWSKHRI